MLRIGLGLVACLVVLCGCAQPQSISMASPPPAPTRLAPEVSLPLDVSEYAKAPCSLLKPGQAITRDLAEGVAEGPTCRWRAKTAQQPEITATVDLKSGGLESLYQKRSRLPYFEPTEVGGFPAVRMDSERAVPDQGRCTVAVGVTDATTLTITSTIADPKTLNYPVPCPDADLFANAIIGDITKK